MFVSIEHKCFDPMRRKSLPSVNDPNTCYPGSSVHGLFELSRRPLCTAGPVNPSSILSASFFMALSPTSSGLSTGWFLYHFPPMRTGIGLVIGAGCSWLYACKGLCRELVWWMNRTHLCYAGIRRPSTTKGICLVVSLPHNWNRLKEGGNRECTEVQGGWVSCF